MSNDTALHVKFKNKIHLAVGSFEKIHRFKRAFYTLNTCARLAYRIEESNMSL